MAGLMDYVQQTFGLEPNIQRPSVLPLPERAAGGNLDWSQWTAPQWLYDAARAVSAPAYAAQGGQLSMDDAYNMAVNVAGGGLMGSAPKRVAGGLMGAA